MIPMIVEIAEEAVAVAVVVVEEVATEEILVAAEAVAVVINQAGVVHGFAFHNEDSGDRMCGSPARATAAKCRLFKV